MLLDEVEEDVDPFGRRDVRVVLLVRALRVSDAREHLGDAFHLKRIAQAQGKAQRGLAAPNGASSMVGTTKSGHAPWQIHTDKGKTRAVRTTRSTWIETVVGASRSSAPGGGTPVKMPELRSRVEIRASERWATPQAGGCERPLSAQDLHVREANGGAGVLVSGSSVHRSPAGPAETFGALRQSACRVWLAAGDNSQARSLPAVDRVLVEFIDRVSQPQRARIRRPPITLRELPTSARWAARTTLGRVGPDAPRRRDQS